jgi:hypothetical protein
VVGELQDRLGLGIGPLAAALRRGELRQDPVPDVEGPRDGRAGGVADRKLRDLRQARLNRVVQPEVADDPPEQRLLENLGRELKAIDLGYAEDNTGKAVNPCERFVNSELIADDLRYVYECISIPSMESEKELVPYGKLSVFDQSKQIIHQELIPFAVDACGEYPLLMSKITSIPNNKLTSPKRDWALVVICGGISSTHQFLKVFMNSPTMLNSTTLHFGDNVPNLTDKNGDGLYEAVAYRRVLFTDVAYSGDRYMTVYQLNIDDTMGRPGGKPDTPGWSSPCCDVNINLSSIPVSLG